MKLYVFLSLIQHCRKVPSFKKYFIRIKSVLLNIGCRIKTLFLCHEYKFLFKMFVVVYVVYVVYVVVVAWLS